MVLYIMTIPWLLSPYARRERDIRIFRKTTEKQLFKQLIFNVNIALYHKLPQDVVSYIVPFIPKNAVPRVDIRRQVTLYKLHYNKID